jgi:hypothetical protein
MADRLQRGVVCLLLVEMEEVEGEFEVEVRGEKG